MRSQRSALLTSTFTAQLLQAFNSPLPVIPGLNIAYGALDMEYHVQLDSLYPLFSNHGPIEACLLNTTLKRLAVDANNLPNAPLRVLFDTEFYSSWLQSNNPAALALNASLRLARKGRWIFALHIGPSQQRTLDSPDHYITVALDWEETTILLADSCEHLYSQTHTGIFSSFQTILASLGFTTPWLHHNLPCPQQVLLDCAVHTLLEVAKLTRTDLDWRGAQPARARTALGVLVLSLSPLVVTDLPPPDTATSPIHVPPCTSTPAHTLAPPPPPTSTPPMALQPPSIRIPACPPVPPSPPPDNTPESDPDSDSDQSDADESAPPTSLPTTPRAPLPSFTPKGIEIFSLNVGPLGAYSGGAEITAMAALNPGAIFLQDLRVYDLNSVRRKRRTVERHLKRLTGYAASADLTNSKAKGRAGGTAVLLHPRLALRSSRLDIAALMDDGPKRLTTVLTGRCAGVRTLALDSDDSTIWLSVYAPTASHPDNSLFYEALLELESRILRTKHEQIVIGGDFNATSLASQRHGYTSLGHVPADLAFRRMVDSSELTLITNMRPTYYSTIHPCSATLDHFLLLDPGGHKLTVTAPAILNLDHLRIGLELGPQAGRELPRPSLSPRPAVFDMGWWKYERARSLFTEDLEKRFVPPPPDTPVHEALSHFTASLNETALEVLGTKVPPSGIPHRNREQKVLLDRLRRYKAGIRELESAIDALGQGQAPRLTCAMRWMWDRTLPPIPSARYASDLVENHSARLALFRTQYSALHERHSKIIFKQRTLRIREYAEQCRERMQDPSSGEIAKLLGKVRDQVPMYAMHTEVPDTLIVSSTHPPAPTYSLHSPGKFQLGPLPSRLLLAALLALPVSTPVSIERTGSAVVTSSEDILSTVEFHYMRLSMSTKWQCTFCPSRSCAHFPCQLPGEATSPLRQICTVCLGCKSPQPSHLPPPCLPSPPHPPYATSPHPDPRPPPPWFHPPAPHPHTRTPPLLPPPCPTPPPLHPALPRVLECFR